MKYLFLIILSFLTTNTFAQYHRINRFRADIYVALPDTTVANIVYKRTATYKRLTVIKDTLNPANTMVAVEWKIYYFNEDSIAVNIVPNYTTEQIAHNKMFLFDDGSIAASSEDELLQKYGIWIEPTDSTEGYWAKHDDGEYVITRDDLWDGVSFYEKKATEPIPINTLIKAAGLRAASEGRLNPKK